MQGQEIEYSEEEIEPGDDARQDMLEHLASGKPWVFIVADHHGDGVGLKVNVGGGLPDTATVRKMLEMTLNALKEEVEDHGEPERLHRSPLPGAVSRQAPDNADGDPARGARQRSADLRHRLVYRAAR